MLVLPALHTESQSVGVPEVGSCPIINNELKDDLFL